MYLLFWLGRRIVRMIWKKAISDKLKISLGEDLVSSIVFQSNWLVKINQIFVGTNSYLRMCWLKAVAGAWTTTVRMHSIHILPCIFGCPQARDQFRHYLICPILWQLAREALSLSEEYFSIGHRMCLVDCSKDKLRLLAYSHILYHALKNDTDCVNASGIIKDSQYIQQNSSNLIKALRPFVS